MAILERKVTQGTISRWLKSAEDWIAAGNVLPETSEVLNRKPAPLDPSRIELGKRQDRHAERQRNRRNSGEDE